MGLSAPLWVPAVPMGPSFPYGSQQSLWGRVLPYGAEVGVCPTERGGGSGAGPAGLPTRAVDPDGAERSSMGPSSPYGAECSSMGPSSPYGADSFPMGPSSPYGADSFPMGPSSP